MFQKKRVYSVPILTLLCKANINDPVCNLLLYLHKYLIYRIDNMTNKVKKFYTKSKKNIRPLNLCLLRISNLFLLYYIIFFIPLLIKFYFFIKVLLF